jgi:hypothetical protein
MKTKNQTEHNVLELSATKAANEEGFGVARISGAGHKQAWCPADVWRTRVKGSSQPVVSEPASR